MEDVQRTFTRWNIFARELEEVLKKRHLRLGHLDDRQDARGRLIHPEKVRRLQISLGAPKTLTTLNPDELERVVHCFNLSSDEEMRLRMALLATAVEMTLMDRVDPYTALLAADEVFHVLVDAMQTRTQLVGIAAVRDATPMSPPAPRGVAAGDTSFDAALLLIDQAVLALHLAHGASEPSETLARAHEAHEKFQQALQALQRVQSPHAASPEWTFWQREALDGKTSASRLLVVNDHHGDNRAN